MLQPVLIALLLLPPRLSAGESAWNTTRTAHFQVHQENAAGRGSGADMERIFMALRRDLRFLSEWADRTKVDVYFYRDRESYLEGRFKPPDWSSGTVRKTGPRGTEWSLALYEPFSRKTFAHELSHLYTASFFERAPEGLPFWLNEGVAAMMEKEIAGPAQPSYRGPKVAVPIPLEEFFRRKGTPDSGSDGAFYAQAHSIVRFLKKGNPSFKFENLCRALRDKGGLESALRGAYGFGSLEQFGKAWKKWAGPAR